jgi:hypothetical protein
VPLLGCVSPSPPARRAQPQPMSSQPNTRRTGASPRRSPAPQPVEPPARGGLDVTTLAAAAIASVVAATVVSRLWQAGTVWATAMTPVIVALVKEAVERPAKRVSSIATRAAAPPLARATRAVAEPPPEAYAPPPPVVGPDPGLSEMRVYRRERATGRHWKLAVATGLLAAIIAVAAMTLPELVAGRSVVSGSHHTTIFGGHRSTSSSKTSTPADEKKKTTTDEATTSTEEQPQGSTTAPDTTTTAPEGQAPTTTAPAPNQAAPTQTQPPPAQTQPPTQTQPPAQTQPPPTTP